MSDGNGIPAGPGCIRSLEPVVQLGIYICLGRFRRRPGQSCLSTGQAATQKCERKDSCMTDRTPKVRESLGGSDWQNHGKQWDQETLIKDYSISCRVDCAEKLESAKCFAKSRAAANT